MRTRTCGAAILTLASLWYESPAARELPRSLQVRRAEVDVRPSGESAGVACRPETPTAPAHVQPGVDAVRSPEAVYIVYYWRARPGKGAAYSDYIRTVAEVIDEEARKAGVFDEVQTYTPAIVTGAPGADWTHMRIFRLKSIAAWEGFGSGLDEAATRVYPDETKRREAMGRSADLRDLVRQEIWRGFR